MDALEYLKLLCALLTTIIGVGEFKSYITSRKSSFLTRQSAPPCPTCLPGNGSG